MDTSNFIKYLSASVILSDIVFYAISFGIPLRPYTDVLVCAILFFSTLTLLVYWLGERALRTNQNNFFLYVIIINVFVKLVASFVFMLIYVKIKNPADRYFLVPFLLTYLIFTISETYILSVQARSSK
jgi:hypothetical protein